MSAVTVANVLPKTNSQWIMCNLSAKVAVPVGLTVLQLAKPATGPRATRQDHNGVHDTHPMHLDTMSWFANANLYLYNLDTLVGNNGWI